jgi:hypothetical protein
MRNALLVLVTSALLVLPQLGSYWYFYDVLKLWPFLVFWFSPRVTPTGTVGQAGAGSVPCRIRSDDIPAALG